MSRHPGPGGGSVVLASRIGTRTNGRFDPLVRFGGPTIQINGIVGLKNFQFAGEVIPPEATIVVRRRASPLFGLGLVDAVPDETFWDLALIQHLFLRETAGIPNFVRDLRSGDRVVGKFGWKRKSAASSTSRPMRLRTSWASRRGALSELPMAARSMKKTPPQGNAALLAFNSVESPNDPNSDRVESVTDFISFLAPPPRGEITAGVRTGAVVFRQIGCANCHVPTLQTGRNHIRALIG